MHGELYEVGQAFGGPRVALLRVPIIAEGQAMNAIYWHGKLKERKWTPCLWSGSIPRKGCRSADPAFSSPLLLSEPLILPLLFRMHVLKEVLTMEQTDCCKMIGEPFHGKLTRRRQAGRWAFRSSPVRCPSIDIVIFGRLAQSIDIPPTA